MTMINVLDKGYVRLVDVMGTDLSPVNAARVSYDKESNEMTSKDERLLKFLAREGHTSPFRHAFLQFEVYAPLMVARQWHKYRIGSTHLEEQDNFDALEAWNESSRRYITEEPTFYIPGIDEWRSKPENSKQGSGASLDPVVGEGLIQDLLTHIEQSEFLYNRAINEYGLCAEQARLFLPAYGMYVRWYWSTSLQGVCHFLTQRLEHDAQKEIQEYAKAVLELAKEKFPISLENLLK
ncbi:Thymidylate synthase ThyX [compost metagenome]